MTTAEAEEVSGFKIGIHVRGKTHHGGGVVGTVKGFSYRPTEDDQLYVDIKRDDGHYDFGEKPENLELAPV
jgi:hypothetical protein